MTIIIFQAGKLGEIPHLLDELLWAQDLLEQVRNGSQAPPERIYGISGGALTASAFALALSAHLQPELWSNATYALQDLQEFLRTAGSRQIRRLKLNSLYGPYSLQPLRHWFKNKLTFYAPDLGINLRLSDLPAPLRLCAADRDGTFTIFGCASDPKQPDRDQFQYVFVRVGPPQDASLLDALIAALSTLLSTEPASVNGNWYRDCRPAIVDAGAIVADLERCPPRHILRWRPHAPVRVWTQNWVTSSFIMHSQNERNQTLLAAYYLDLLERQQTLKSAYEHLLRRLEETGIRPDPSSISSPVLGHVDLPYVGSTEAATNMRQSVENKSALMARFRNLLEGQLDSFPFNRPANVIYGAGGFSGILAGLVTTRQVEQRFSEQGGEIQQIYGISAGVLNGFFHAVQVAAKRYPDLYRPAAHSALKDLEDFIAHLTPRQIARINLNPIEFWQGWANLQPLASFLAERLSAYTGSSYPMQITFDDIGLPFTVAAARLDGYTDFLGISHLDRRMFFGNCDWTVRPATIIQAMLAGWSMNTYIIPTRIREQSYTDGGGTFYDPALFVACFDPQLINLLNIHLDEPDGHSYNLPPRPNLLRILFDTHNYVFPEERRRMRFLSDLLYQHYALRHQYLVLLNAAQTVNIQDLAPLPEDFRRKWQPDTWYINPPPILPSKEKR